MVAKHKSDKVDVAVRGVVPLLPQKLIRANVVIDFMCKKPYSNYGGASQGLCQPRHSTDLYRNITACRPIVVQL